jgi:prepilin-type N-terminal cleavage/methylation domain-containing protein
MRRARGFSLVEVLVALALAGVMSAFLLMITRSQLSAYRVNDQVTRAQVNARAGAEFVEGVLRRACGGLSAGAVSVNVGAVSKLTTCVKVYDGAEGPNDYSSTGGTFTMPASTQAASKSDAIEVIYGTSPMTIISPSTTPSVNAAGTATICDGTGFSAGDFVLLTNMQAGFLMKIASIQNSSNPPTCTNQVILTFDATGPATALPAAIAGVATPTPAAGDYVLKAQSYALYRFNKPSPSTSLDKQLNGNLVLDPDGIAGADHSDAEPVVEGVDNFEIAVAADGDNNGTITESTASPSTDEWMGNAAGELPLTTQLNAGVASGFFNVPATTPLAPQYKQIRATILARTIATYGGASSLDQSGTATPAENRSLSSLVVSQGGNAPKYRVLRVNVAPRIWNLLN